MFKKISIAVGSVVAGVAGVLAPAAFASASTTPIISINTASSTELLAYAGQLFSDLWVLVVISIGIPLGFYIIKGAIGLVRSRHKA
jgi:hypothetical protein